MKKRIKLGGLLILALILAMAIGIGNVSALNEYKPVTGGLVQVTKNVNLHGAESGPTHTVTVSAVFNNQSSDDTMPPEGTVNPLKLHFSGNENTKTGYLDFSTVTFTTPGWYRYYIREADSDSLIKPIDPQRGVYYLDVFVINDPNDPTGLKIEKYVAYKGEVDEDNKATGIIFDNDWDCYSFKVAKEVKGRQGNKTRYFDIKVNLTRSNSYTKKIVFSWVSGAPKVGSVILTEDSPTHEINNTSSNTTYTISLRDGDQIDIEGLDTGTKYTIIETPPRPYSVENNVENAVTPSTENNGRLYTIINTREDPIPTGIFINNWPYIAAILVVLAGCIMFIRRRRISSEYDEDL